MKHFIPTKTQQLLLFCMSLFINLQAQNTSGKLVDEKNNPLPFANIVLITLPDSSFVTGTISNNDGTFNLDLPNSSKPRTLRFSSIGYTTLYRTATSGNMGIIQLNSDEQILDEIIVKGHLPSTSLRNGAIVSNIKNSVLSKAGSANDVLRKMPGIIKQKEGIEVFGKGTPLIYINSRKLNDLTELEQLNSEDIAKVEIIYNPGEEYDATVKSVIRIHTIRRKGEGFGFNLRSSIYQSKNSDFIEQAGFNYHHNNLELFGNFYYSSSEYWQKSNSEQIMQGSKYWNHNQQSYFQGKNNMTDGDLSFNWRINQRHEIGGKYRVGKNLFTKDKGETEKNISINQNYYDRISTYNLSREYSDPQHELNVFYTGEIGKSTLNLNINYFQNSKRNTSFTEEISASTESRDVHSTSYIKNQLTAGKLTITSPLFGGKIAMGSEVTYTHRHDHYQNQENYVPSSYSKIKETNTSIFTGYSHSYKWGSWSIGARYEHVQFKYFENGVLKKEQSNTFDNLFPHLSFSTKLGSIQSQLDYAAKIERPSFSQLDNNIIYADRYTQQKGDATLQPSITHCITLSSVWKFIQANLSYSQIKNWIVLWGDLIEKDGSLLMLHYRNWNKSIPSLNFLVSVSPSIGIWSPSWSIAMQKQWLTIHTDKKHYTMNQPLFTATFNNTWNLPSNFMISLDMGIQSKGDYQNTYSNQCSGEVNIAVRKSFLNDALSVEIKGMDLFNTKQSSFSLQSGDYNLIQKSTWDRRECSLTVRYKFNSTKKYYNGSDAGTNERQRLY